MWRTAVRWGLVVALIAPTVAQAGFMEGAAPATVLDLLVDEGGRPAVLTPSPAVTVASSGVSVPGQPRIIWTMTASGNLADPDTVSLVMTNRPGGAIAMAPDHVVRWLLRASGNIPQLEGRAGAVLCLRAGARGVVLRNEGTVSVLAYSRSKGPASIGGCGASSEVDVSE